MQVIRMSRNAKDRSIITKLYEMILAVRLEMRYSKQEIMNLYASHAPFGGNVVGLDAASWRYYNRPAYMLSWGETAALAVLPNAPALVFPGKNHEALMRKRNRLLKKLQILGIIDKTTCELAMYEPLPLRPQALPQMAPHLLERVVSDGNIGKRIQTTVDSKIQNYANDIAQKYARLYASNYINNVAVLVLDTKTGEVKAYVGNVDFLTKQTNQCVDNVSSKRSSGSILKPFLYAGMLSEGDILPNSLIADIPTRIGGYAPENFEKTYEGAVPASIALAHSLNIPAVRELQDFGLDKFHYLLQDVGFTSINQPADYYGLSLILGGAEVSLWETTAMYASLGRSLLSYISNDSRYLSNDYRQATYLPYKSTNPDKLINSKFSAAALWYTFEAMASVNRPWGEIGWEYFASAHKIAWKTGTSFGHRDAWAVGITPEYTVGVWVGNSTGEGRPGLTGLTHASPIMFEMFKNLGTQSWFKIPYDDMVTVEVCKQSGYRATPLCEVEKLRIPKQGVKVKACPYHQRIFMDSTKTYRVTSACYPVSSMQIVSWFVLPPAQEWFYKPNHPNYVTLPPYMKGCFSPKEQVLDILQPDNNSAIYIPKGFDGEAGMLIFEAVHRDPKMQLFWHIDGEYITTTKLIHKIEVAPTVGMHTVFVMDEQGNSVERKFKIMAK
jgi:penicillin-binding protein 1C